MDQVKRKSQNVTECVGCGSQYNSEKGRVCPSCQTKRQTSCLSCNMLIKKPANTKNWSGLCNRCFHGDDYAPKKDKQDTRSKKSPTRREKRDKLLNKSRAAFVPQHNNFQPNVNVGVAGNVNIPDAPPPPPLNNPNRPPINAVEIDNDDESEESTEEDCEMEEEEEFEYVTTRHFAWIFEYKVKRKGTLPKSLLKLVIPYQNTVNTMTYRQYELLLKSDPKISDYMTEYSTRYGLSQWQKLLEQYRNFFFCYKQRQAEYMLRLNRGNANVFETQRNIYSTHTKPPVFNPWLYGAIKTGIYVGASLLTYYYVRGKFRDMHALGAGEWKTIWFGSRRFPGRDLPHTLIHTFPNFSRYLEEIIKSVPYGYKIVAYLEYLKYGHWGTYNWHKQSSTWKFSDRLRKHKNKQYRPERTGTLFNAYCTYVHTGNPPQYEPIVEEFHAPYLPARKLPIPKGSQENKPYQVLSPLKADDDDNYEGIYPMMYCVNSMVRPAATWDNQCATILERITLHDNSKFKKITHKFHLLDIVKDMPISHIDDPDWYRNLTKIQKDNIKKTKEKHDNGITESVINCQIKNDEIINGLNKSVARFICNLSGEDFYLQGKITSEISHWLSEYWGPHANNGLSYNGFNNKIYFTCGATSSSLDAFVNHLIDNGLTGQLVMGDDTWMLKLDGPRMYVIENDFSRYDRTHHRGLRDIFSKVLINNGYGELVTLRDNMYKKDLNMKTKVKKGHGKLPNCNYIYGKKTRVDQLLTGEPGTCLVNSFTNALTATYIFNEQILDVVKYKQDAIETFDECGLICRDMAIHTTISAASFLKGAFLLGNDEKYHWVRLPSFLSKFGKVLKPHNIIMKNAKNPNDRARKLLKAQWLGYGNMKTNWFYRALDAEIVRICQDVKTEKECLEFWQIEQDLVDIPYDIWNDFVFQRYGLTIDDMEQFISTLQTIDPIMLPCIYYAPMIDALVERDY